MSTSFPSVVDDVTKNVAIQRIFDILSDKKIQLSSFRWKKIVLFKNLQIYFIDEVKLVLLYEAFSKAITTIKTR